MKDRCETSDQARSGQGLREWEMEDLVEEKVDGRCMERDAKME